MFLADYVLQYVINYFVALYFGYVVKYPIGMFLSPLFCSNGPPKVQRSQLGNRLTVKMQPDRPNDLVSSLKRLPSRLLLGPDYGTQ